MKVRRIRLVAVGVGVANAGDDGGTSPPTDSPPFGPAASGDADAAPGVSSDVVVSRAVDSGAAQAVNPARSEAPKTPSTARRAGVETGTAEWSPHMAVPSG
jgi:hypothetical protein